MCLDTFLSLGLTLAMPYVVMVTQLCLWYHVYGLDVMFSRALYDYRNKLTSRSSELQRSCVLLFLTD